MILTNVIITAYCACKVCCGPNASNHCADGKTPVAGVTVAASRQFKLGSHLKIQGMTNDFIIQDRLANRFDSRVDVFFTRHQDALRFGRKVRTVEVKL